MSKIFSVGLIGLGRVGARDDFVRKKFCRTHLLTILKNKNLKLKFIIEPDEKKIIENKDFFPEIQDDKYFRNISDLDKKNIDILIYAGPIQNKFLEIQKCIDLQPKFFLIEKPLSNKIEDAKQIVNLFKNTSITVGINYMRRFQPFLVEKLKNPNFNLINFKYTGGFFNNGTHLLDLIHFYLGGIQNLRILNTCHMGYLINDPFLSFSAKNKNDIIINFISLGDLNYNVIELEIYNKNAKIELVNNFTKKIEIPSKINCVFPGYIHLNQDKKQISENFDSGFEKLYQNIISYLRYNKKLSICSLEDSLRYIKFFKG